MFEEVLAGRACVAVCGCPALSSPRASGREPLFLFIVDLASRLAYGPPTSLSSLMMDSTRGNLVFFVHTGPSSSAFPGEGHFLPQPPAY